MGKRTWVPGSPEYLYHVYDDDLVTAAFTKAWKNDIVGLMGGTDRKEIFSLKKDMDALRAYGVKLGIVDPISTIGKARPDNNDLMVLKVGKGTAHKVLFTGCHHAREWISVEIPYLVAEYLIRNYTAKPTTPKQKRIKHLLMNRQITFIPMVNPNGHEYTVKGNRDWRPNRWRYTAPSADLPSTQPPKPPLKAPQYEGGPDREIRYDDGTYIGLDINRNYPTKHWGKETEGGQGASRDPMDGGFSPGATIPGRMVWCGPKAGSEQETKLIMKLKLENFRSVISYHNFFEVIFYPDDAVGNVFVEWVGNGMITLIAQPPGHAYRFWNNSAKEEGNYLTTGELADYAYEKSPGRPVYTPELRPRDIKSPRETWKFSGLPESEIEPCFLENLPAALALINCAGHNAKAASQSTKLATGSPPTKCQMVRHCWEVFRGWTP